MKKLLIANRGEIAIRIAQSAALAGVATVAVYTDDDALSLHVRRSDEAARLPGAGAAGYLDGDAIIAAAIQHGCDAVHPGYGFLSESADFASACTDAGLTFVGPTPDMLAKLGDKVQARAIAARHGLPTPAGVAGPASLPEIEAFFDSLGADAAVMLKAVAGGGGRGMRPVTDRADLANAYERCASEAASAFGIGDLYVEQLVRGARHVEVQIIGDGQGGVSHLWDRECSLQRQRQKVIEIAPAVGLDPAMRAELLAAAVKLGAAVGYRGLGTIEFLVTDRSFFFIEANARLQVEHTVTEQVTALDLVGLQLAIADGRTLQQLGLTQADIPPPRGIAVQARVNMETMAADGASKPAAGLLDAYEPPSGPGVRVDGFGYAGYRASVRFDSLLAKVIVHANADFASVASATDRALRAFRIEGVATNIGFLRSVLRHPDVAELRFDTGFIGDHLGELLAEAADLAPQSLPAPSQQIVSAATTIPTDIPDGHVGVNSPLQGTVVALLADEGSDVAAGQGVMVIEAMKMEHLIAADVSGRIGRIAVTIGQTVMEHEFLFHLKPDEIQLGGAVESAEPEPDHIRADLAEVRERLALTHDAARPDAIAKRHRLGFRSARENIDDLCDPGSFVEYGALVIAGRRLRTPVDELIRTTPADGKITGVGTVNADLYGPDAARCVVMSYDYTVFAGTQGLKNHEKTDRMLELAYKWQLPVILFAESGGGRPGDTDRVSGGGIFNTKAFALQGKLSALVPQIGIANGRCFAGAAVLLGCCDVIIATKGSTIGVGGPAVIEGGGLGSYTPEEIGPVSVQAPGGVIDIVVADEAEAVAVAKRYLSYFQGPVQDWSCADQRRLRHVIPENRLRTYDVRRVIDLLADEGSVLELRDAFGKGVVTVLARIEGRPIGIIASNPMHLGGAIDADAADKAARFMQLCDAFDLPIVVLADTPGNMVGPEAEKTGLLRHCCRLFLVGPNLTVPVFTVVLRKGYGLGVMAMAGGSSHSSFFTIAWPTGEFGGMNLEGAIKLGYRKELAAIEDPVEREQHYAAMVADAYEDGKALSTAMGFDIDDVIDPADTRQRIVAGLRSAPVSPRTGKKRPFIDAW